MYQEPVTELNPISMEVTVNENGHLTITPQDFNSDSEFGFNNTIRMTSLRPFLSSMPKLTVPDLADTLEQMLARRAAGIPTTFMRTQRIYPTDPATIYTAAQVLKDIQTTAKIELEQTNKQIALNKQEAEKIAKEQQKRAKEFEEFQNQRDKKA
jgi:hypothetical protein